MNKNSFKKCMVCFLLIGSICSVIACGSNPKIHGAAESVDNWEAALQYLKDGNKRFVNITELPETPTRRTGIF